MTVSLGQNVMVTGGAGFIGSHLVDLLAERVERVLVFDDFSTGATENLSDHEHRDTVEVIEGSVLDVAALRKAMRGIDTVFHMAVQCVRLSLSDPYLVHKVNATGSLNVALESVEAGVQRLVYVSSSEVYGTAITTPMTEDHPLNATTVYGASKLAGELYTQAVWQTYGLPVVVVRPFNAYGPRAHLLGASGEVIPRFIANSLLSQQSEIYGDGQQTRDFTFVHDTARGIAAAATAEELTGGVVNIAAGTPVTIEALARMIAEETGTSELTPRFADSRPADVMHHHASIEKARNILGFEPTVEIRDGVRRYVRWMRERPEFWQEKPEQFAAPNW